MSGLPGKAAIDRSSKAQIEELGLGTRVKLLGWRDDRAALFQAVDICAFISRDEGIRDGLRPKLGARHAAGGK